MSSRIFHCYILCKVFLNEFYFIIFLRFYLFIFRERGGEGEREGEKPQFVVASCSPPTGDLTHNPGMCPDRELNWQPFGSQDRAQPTELHQPGHILCNVDSLYSKESCPDRLMKQKSANCREVYNTVPLGKVRGEKQKLFEKDFPETPTTIALGAGPRVKGNENFLPLVNMRLSVGLLLMKWYFLCT